MFKVSFKVQQFPLYTLEQPHSLPAIRRVDIGMFYPWKHTNIIVFTISVVNKQAFIFFRTFYMQDVRMTYPRIVHAITKASEK